MLCALCALSDRIEESYSTALSVIELPLRAEGILELAG